ncbi:metal ABC transporter substrate-binding protein [Nocardioides insulae]|uniref:metal ABC transporter substrate-binding protein n=1 Tax=Nocardioides insulae TaxID=394734 RepID=UPI0004050F42|nr:metal ABC transporter substrate-binding protein [Nocardioides insulae]
MKFPVLPAVGACLLASALTGCAAFSDDSEPAADGKLTVVTAMYPLQYLAERVAGEEADVVSVANPGQDPHDLELTPVQTATVMDADLVLYEDGMQAALDAAVDQADGVPTVDAAQSADLVPVEDHESDLVSGDSEEAHEHEHEDGEEDGEEHADEHEGHDHGDLDPHFWHDPQRMATVAEALADELSELDPDNADVYAGNLADFRADLDSVDQEFTQGLAQCRRDVDVVSHDAFGYLTKYGLKFAPIAGLSPDAEPTPADLGRLHELIQDEGLTTVFTERLAPPELSEQLAKDEGVDTAVLDPIEALTDETADEDYLSLMRENLDALRKANGCR